MTRQNHVLCVGLTPALQRTLVFDALKTGEVNRASSATLSAAGKGVSVASVLKTLGSQPLLAGFIGGTSGDIIAKEVQARDIKCEWVHVRQRTRNCHTLVDQATGTVTELVEEASCPTADEWAQMQAVLASQLDRAAYITMSGALPPGSSPEIYADIVGRANNREVPAIIDSQGPPLLKALPHKPLLVKMTVSELARTCSMSATTDADMIEGLKQLHRHGATWALVTQSAKTAWLFDGTDFYRYGPPRIEAVNPIGSGDATTAGTVHALAEGQPMPEAVRYGIACGTANALTERPGLVHMEDVERLAPQVSFEKA